MAGSPGMPEPTTTEPLLVAWVQPVSTAAGVEVDVSSLPPPQATSVTQNASEGSDHSAWAADRRGSVFMTSLSGERGTCECGPCGGRAATEMSRSIGLRDG